MDFFKKLTISTSFPVCYNLLPHYTAEGQKYAPLMNCVEEALSDGRIHNFLLTDHPLHSQKISSLQLAEDIIAAGGDPLVSLALTFYDKNEAIEKLQQYCKLGVRQFLFVSGEYPSMSDNKQEKTTFDLDCVQLLMLLEDLGISAGLKKSPGSPNITSETPSIVKGCAVSPFKSLESEQVWQYEKLKRKIEVGADFVITQLGYDLRKFDELVRFCALQNISVPLVANIFITDRITAQLIREQNIPGVKMPDRLLQSLAQEESDPQKAKEKQSTRAAQTLAVLRGLGYHGVLIGGSSPDFSAVKQVMDKAEEIQSDWPNFLDDLDYSDSSFYYFQKDSQPGLNNNKPSPVTPKHFPYPMYSFSYFVDWMVYLPQGPLFKVTGRFCRFCNGRKFWHSSIWLLEFLSKGLLYGCNMCGDCVLYACGFLCYQSGCPKKMANGPCGGSTNGYCEVFPDKKLCYWVKVYKHMKGASQHVTYIAPPIPARDTALNKTSSWINFFQGRDHRKMHFEDD
jgi:methylenetetrahydrofolate reductase (NADPH)